MQNMPANENEKALSTQQQGRPEVEAEIDLLGLFYRLMEKIVWIVLAGVIGGAIMGFYSYKVLKPVYQATSKIYIIGSDTTISISDLQLGNNLAADYQEVFKNWHVSEMVKQRMGLEYLPGSVSVSNPQGTHVLYITATGGNPVDVKMLADTYAEVAREFIAAKMDMREPNIFEEARVPGGPIGPQKSRNILMGILMGMLFAAAIITVQFLLDDRIRTEEDITKVTGLATLGMVPLQDTRKLGLPDEQLNKKKKA